MSLVLLTGLLVLNVLISTWNAYVTGRTWDATQGTWARVVAWSGLIMAGSGFTYVTLALLGWGAFMLGKLTDESLNALLSLGYLAIILPVLGSGFVITLHSWQIAWRRRRFTDMAIGGYNTFAQASNTIHALRDVPGAWDVVAQFFGGKKSRSKDSEKATVLLLAVVAIAAGSLITYAIFAAGRRHARLAEDRARRAARVGTRVPA